MGVFILFKKYETSLSNKLKEPPSGMGTEEIANGCILAESDTKV